MSTAWYYIQNNQQQGPIAPDEFEQRCEAGDIGPSTLVFTGGMRDWAPLSEARNAGLLDPSSVEGEEASPRVQCPSCDMRVALDDLIPLGETHVCPWCRDRVLQQHREGANPFALHLNLAGFGIRLGAYMIDYTILYMANMLVGMAMGMGMLGSMMGDIERLNVTLMVLYYATSVMIPLLYATLFIGHPKCQGTPGMMLVRIKCVRPDLSRVTFRRALGRYFATWVTSMTLTLGYFMVLWDEERRTLHDMLADVRVVRRNP